MSIRILVVEDDLNKLRRVTQVLGSVEGISTEDITHAADVASAVKRLVTEGRFDLLVLDISLPLRIDEVVTPDGGVILLKEIAKHNAEAMPRFVVGLTGYADVYKEAAAAFLSGNTSLLYFDAGSDLWEEPLKARSKHLLQSKETINENLAYGAFLGVVCALDAPELRAVRRLPWDWQDYFVTHDHAIYYRGTIPGRGNVIATASPRMGLPTAAAVASKVIYTVRPKYLAMVGIAAGIPGKAVFGDVIVADPSWDWGSGKWIRQADELEFRSSPHQVSLAPALRDRFRRLSEDAGSLAEIRERWPGEPPNTPLRVRVAPMASGASVVADSGIRAIAVEQHRNLAAVEMETYSIFAAADECSDPRPSVMSIKAVVDFADGEKNDTHQNYGAYAAAEILKLFVEKFLIAE